MKILIVEDEEKIANSLRKGFLRENFLVDLEYDGLKGLSSASINEYDAIILDLMLPSIDGITILNKLREKSIYTPVIILTAKDTIEDKVNGLNLGADDYLAKPFSFEELLARIRSVIRRSTNKESILKIDSLELNPFSHIVKRNDSEIDLSSKEFALLEYLMRNSNRVISESQILEHVWDSNYDGMSNIVAAYIKNLRQKIDKKKNRKALIQTIRGIGYKISE